MALILRDLLTAVVIVYLIWGNWRMKRIVDDIAAALEDEGDDSDER